jgi:sulfite reductase alpha subunit-like flavoprotein
LHFIHEGIGCREDHAIEVTHARFQEKLHELRTRVGRTVLSSIVIADDGDDGEDDTAWLSDIIALVEAFLQAEEDEDDTGKLSELITLVESGLQAEEDVFFS